jgi:hypothetical protein
VGRALHPAARATWNHRADLRATAALLVLENAALRREQSRALDALKRRLDGRHDAVRDSRVARAAQALAGRLSRPAGFLPANGYGQPVGAERSVARERLGSAAREWTTATDALWTLGESVLPGTRRDALRATRGNVERLSARLRDQAREAHVPAG